MQGRIRYLLKLLPLPIIPKLRRQHRLHILLVHRKHQPLTQDIALHGPTPQPRKHAPPELMVAVAGEVPHGLDDGTDIKWRERPLDRCPFAEGVDCAFMRGGAEEDFAVPGCGEEEEAVGECFVWEGARGPEEGGGEGVEEGGGPDAVEEGGEHFCGLVGGGPSFSYCCLYNDDFSIR